MTDEVIFNVQDDQKVFLTIQEAADFLKVSKTSLRRWSNSGHLPCFRVGTRNERRFLLTDLKSFMSRSESALVNPDQNNVQHSPRKVDQQASESLHHISSYYRNESEQWKALIPYLGPNLKPNTRTIYIHDSDEQTIHEQLLKFGFDPMELKQNGTLRLFASDQTYLLGNVFNPERMLKFWQKMIGQAIQDGIEKILLTGEMGWALRGLPGSELLCSYEQELDQFLTNFPMVTVVCQYPLKEFSGEIIFDSMCSHPHLQINKDLFSGFQL